MISQSQLILIEALKVALFGAKADYPDATDWDGVIAEAKAQTVMGLISPVIPVQDESAEQCKASYMRIMYEQDRLVRLLNSNGIPFIILKGIAASVYYPKPYLRTMGDIDILVPRKMFNVAVDLMETNGYTYIKTNDGAVEGNIREIVFSVNGIEIELHHYFSSPGFDIDDILEAAIERRETRVLNGYNFPVLPEVENGLVLLGHINQHLKNNGLGLRQIIDWEMYLHSIEDKSLWEKQFVPLADKAGLLSLAAYVICMCNKHLGLPESFDMCKGIDDELTDELLDVIMTDGNFGRRDDKSTSGDEQRMRSAMYSIKRYGFFKYFTKVGLDNWGLGKDRKLLKPLAFFYGLFRQVGIGIKALFKNKGVGKQMSVGKKRYELYKKLGVRNGEK